MSDEANFNKFCLKTFDISRYVKLDTAVVKSLIRYILSHQLPAFFAYWCLFTHQLVPSILLIRVMSPTCWLFQSSQSAVVCFELFYKEL